MPPSLAPCGHQGPVSELFSLRCAGAAVGADRTRISGSSPRESGAPGLSMNVCHRAPPSSLKPSPPGRLRPRSCHHRGSHSSGCLGPFCQALLCWLDRPASVPHRWTVCHVSRMVFGKLLPVWTAVAPWGSRFSLPGCGVQRELGEACFVRTAVGRDLGAPLSSVLWGRGAAVRGSAVAGGGGQRPSLRGWRAGRVPRPAPEGSAQSVRG